MFLNKLFKKNKKCNPVSQPSVKENAERKEEQVKCCICLRKFDVNNIVRYEDKNYCRECYPNFPSNQSEQEYFDELWHYAQVGRK